MDRFDLNLLTVFDAIYRDGSVTRAAERLHLTQPALSHALGRLRDLFGDPLFVRKGRNLAPTLYARNVADEIGSALRVLQATIRKREEFRPAEASLTLSIGVRDVLEATVLPGLVAAVRAAAPGISVVARHVDRSAAITELASGSVDVIIDVLLEVPEEIHMALFSEEELCVVTRQHHPAVNGELDLDNYLALEHVAVSARRRGLTFEDVELSRLGLSRTTRVRCQRYISACSIVAQTDLMLTMPRRYAEILNTAGTQIINVPFASRPMGMYLYWHESTEGEPANRWLRDQLMKLSAQAIRRDVGSA